MSKQATKGEERWSEDVVMLPVALVRSDPTKTREINQDRVKELAASIKQKGLQQPIKVRPNGQGWTVTFGEHRLEAFRFLGLSKIPAIIKQTKETDAMELKLTENAHRNTFVNPYAEGAILDRLVHEKYGGNLDAMCEALGKTNQWAKDRMNVFFNLDPSLVKFIGNKLTGSNVITIAKLGDKAVQRQVADKITASRTANLLQYRQETGNRTPPGWAGFGGGSGGMGRARVFATCVCPTCGREHTKKRSGNSVEVDDE